MNEFKTAIWVWMNFIKSACCYSYYLNERATDISNDEHAERIVLDHQHWQNFIIIIF